MTIWDEIEELNTAAAKIGGDPWFYTGDRDITQGGTATRVDRKFCFAEVVECTDLASAIGQDGCVMIERNSVSFPSGSDGRKRMREALATSGMTVRELAADYQGENRWKRWAWIAESFYRYGYRDTPATTVLRFEEADEDAEDQFEVDATVDGVEGVKASFMGDLD